MILKTTIDIDHATWQEQASRFVKGDDVLICTNFTAKYNYKW